MKQPVVQLGKNEGRRALARLVRKPRLGWQCPFCWSGHVAPKVEARCDNRRRYCPGRVVELVDIDL